MKQRSDSTGSFMKGYKEINTVPLFNTQMSIQKDPFD